MESKTYLDEYDVAQYMGVPVSYARKIIRDINADLKALGISVEKDKIKREYLEKALYSCSLS